MVDIPNHMKIAIIEIKGKLDKSLPTDAKLKQAMKLAMNHWLVTNEDEQFRCAVGAVLLIVSHEEQAIIKEELNFLRTLSSASMGVPVDFETALSGVHAKKWYGLSGLWIQVKEQVAVNRR